MDNKPQITATGRTVADFIAAQEALIKIYLEKDRFGFFYFNGGVVNSSSPKQFSEYNVFINIAFKLLEEIPESEEDKLISIDTVGFFKFASFENIVRTLSLVCTNGILSTKTDEPSLLLMSSEVKLGMTLEHKNTATNNLIINTVVVDAEHFDSFKRKTILPENLPDIKRNL